mgnify:CR=1 FL=1
MHINEKIAVADALQRLNVDIIEAGYPAASEGDFEAVRQIAKRIRTAEITGLARCKQHDIDVLWDALKEAENPRLHLFIATSPIHLAYKYKITPDAAIDTLTDAIRYAKKYTDNVQFSFEDASRTPLDYLVKVTRLAVDAGVSTINIPDTVGYSTPDEMANIVKTLLSEVDGLCDINLSVHCHDDLGLAVANSLSAVKAGANQIEGTVLGIGERAGNADLEEIIMALKTRGDYFDAIFLSNLALKSRKFYAEGGAKNVARRDGMATTVLSAVTTIGRIPDYYFQAVGSGTGAIAAWEANMRLIGDGRFGTNTMKLMVSQNAPFVPMYDAWQADSRKMLPYEDDKARRDAEIIDAKVLSNRRPPYGITGGLYDALKATGGEFFVSTNAMARKARKLFHELEGVDIYSAAGVALASLINAVAAGKVEKDATVMLNVTGGGEEHFKEGKELWYLKPSHVFPLEPDTDDVVAKVEALFN